MEDGRSPRAAEPPARCANPILIPDLTGMMADKGNSRRLRKGIELRPRGAPPPAPPRSFLTEREKFDPASTALRSTLHSRLTPPLPRSLGRGTTAVARNEQKGRRG